MRKRISESDLLSLHARRICVIKPSAFGDVVQALPLLPVLKERFRGAWVSWVINRELSDLVSGHPQLDEMIPFDRRGSLRSWRSLLRKLRRREFDLVFDLQGLLRTALMTTATRAALRIGLETAREGSQLACHLSLSDTGRLVPAHARYWRVAEAIGAGELKRRTLVQVASRDREWTDSQLAVLRTPLLAIHPGARWLTKRWPVEKFAVVACKAMRLFGFSAVIVGGPAEESTGAELEDMLRRFIPSRPVLNLTGQTSIKQLSCVLSAADVLLTSDSGPMHLASGVGTPVLGVFTCTSPERSGPPGDQHELISTELECAASYQKRCPHRGSQHMACMAELTTERACQAMARLVEKNGLGILPSRQPDAA